MHGEWASLLDAHWQWKKKLTSRLSDVRAEETCLNEERASLLPNSGPIRAPELQQKEALQDSLLRFSLPPPLPFFLSPSLT